MGVVNEPDVEGLAWGSLQELPETPCCCQKKLSVLAAYPEQSASKQSSSPPANLSKALMRLPKYGLPFVCLTTGNLKAAAGRAAFEGNQHKFSRGLKNCEREVLSHLCVDG